MTKHLSRAEITKLLKERLSEIGAKGGKTTSNALTPAERKEKASMAANVRWAKAKKPAKA